MEIEQPLFAFPQDLSTAQQLQRMYSLMLQALGPQHWWPAETPLEVLVGAILTQNTNWKNVERAIARLREADVLSLPGLLALSSGALAEYIRPAGYYNLKAGRLLNLLSYVQEQYDGDLSLFFAQELPVLRRQLLGIKGVGPETADSILLYAAEKPIFVVDTYTHRILFRHQLIDSDADYPQIQELFMDHLVADVALYNEFHALLVRVGNCYCKKKAPDCTSCPLQHLS